MTSKSLNAPPDFVLELAGLEQRLFDAERGEQFVVRVDHYLKIARRSVVALLGPSGCGKTTLLTVLGLLRSPSHLAKLETFIMRTQGPNGSWIEYDLRQIWLRRQRRQIERLRREHIGFALQNGELLPSLTVRENIAVPLRLNGLTGKRCWDRVNELLTTFRLDGSESTDDEAARQRHRRRLAYSRINKLSGGEYQRVALARAIAHRPTLLYVDEPTSALNRELAWGALEQMRLLQCSESSQGAAVMITHDEQLAIAFADVIIRMAPVKGQPVGEVVEIVNNTPSISTSPVTTEMVSKNPIMVPQETSSPLEAVPVAFSNVANTADVESFEPLTLRADA